jgi:outer membrane protein OmpA-like peptidoglycan-associated protein
LWCLEAYPLALYSWEAPKPGAEERVLPQEVAERAAAEREAAARTQAERDRAAAELEKTRAELEASRKAAEDAQRAAESERQRLEAERKAQAEREAELARLQAEQRKTQEELRKTLSQLASVREEARGLIVTLPGSIYFDVNKSDVKPAMRARLTEIARALATVPGQKVLIEGHTDSDGTAEYNLQLSRLRSDSVRSVLVAGGVSPDRVEAQGYGETRPVATNATAAGKAQNRRVELVLEGSAAAPR